MERLEDRSGKGEEQEKDRSVGLIELRDLEETLQKNNLKVQGQDNINAVLVKSALVETELERTRGKDERLQDIKGIELRDKRKRIDRTSTKEMGKPKLKVLTGLELHACSVVTEEPGRRGNGACKTRGTDINWRIDCGPGPQRVSPINLSARFSRPR
ncbi:hypothetical protein Trydic_g13765 [Trypoxylus dichotomus]